MQCTRAPHAYACACTQELRTLRATLEHFSAAQARNGVHQQAPAGPAADATTRALTEKLEALRGR